MIQANKDKLGNLKIKGNLGSHVVTESKKLK